MPRWTRSGCHNAGLGFVVCGGQTGAVARSRHRAPAYGRDVGFDEGVPSDHHARGSKGLHSAVSAVGERSGAVVFFALHKGLQGVYLGCSFAPAHKGMPVMTPDQADDPLLRQVLTSRNVPEGPVIDLVMGGAELPD